MMILWSFLVLNSIVGHLTENVYVLFDCVGATRLVPGGAIESEVW